MYEFERVVGVKSVEMMVFGKGQEEGGGGERMARCLERGEVKV